MSGERRGQGNARLHAHSALRTRGTRALQAIAVAALVSLAACGGSLADDFYDSYQPGTLATTRGPLVFCLTAEDLQLYLAYQKLEDREKMIGLAGCGIDVTIGLVDVVIVERQHDIIRVVAKLPSNETVEFWTPVDSVISKADSEAGRCMSQAREDGIGFYEAIEKCSMR